MPHAASRARREGRRVGRAGGGGVCACVCGGGGKGGGAGGARELARRACTFWRVRSAAEGVLAHEAGVMDDVSAEGVAARASRREAELAALRLDLRTLEHAVWLRRALEERQAQDAARGPEERSNVVTTKKARDETKINPRMKLVPDCARCRSKVRLRAPPGRARLVCHCSRLRLLVL